MGSGMSGMRRSQSSIGGLAAMSSAFKRPQKQVNF